MTENDLSEQSQSMVTIEGYGDRVRNARGKINQAEFAASIGVSLKTLGRIERGERSPNGPILARICTIHGLNPEWLLLGRGPMRPSLSLAVPVAADTDTAIARPVEELPAGVVGVPLLSLRLAAGGGAPADMEHIERYMYFDEAWLWRQYRVKARDLAMFQVLGDSMEPVFRANDWLLIDISVDGARLGDGVFALRIEGDIYLKRLQVLPGRRLKVSSYNAAYEPFEVQLSDGVDVQILGRVVIRMGRH